MDYGMKDQIRIDNVLFYCKADPSKAIKISKEQVGFYPPQLHSWQLEPSQCFLVVLAVFVQEGGGICVLLHGWLDWMVSEVFSDLGDPVVLCEVLIAFTYEQPFTCFEENSVFG